MIQWPPGKRIVLHVDFDAFFASVEVRRNPKLRGRPVIVGGTSNRGVVSAASYEAREFGVHSAMPIWQARRRCPDGVFLPVDGEAYSEYSVRAREILAQFSPRMDPASIDEAYLDVTGSLRLFGGLEALLDRIRSDIRDELGITVSVGCAPNRLVAKIASDWDKPDGLTIVHPDELPERLFELPVDDIPGIGEVTAGKLAQMGVRTIGQLAKVPQTLLERHFGKHGTYLHRAAHGRDESPVPYYQPGDDARKQISREETLAQDTRDLEVLEQRLLALTEEVARRLRRRGQRARTVTLKVKLSNFKLFTRSETLQAPTELEDDIFSVARELLGRVRFGAQMARLIGVGVSNLTEGSGPGQLSLFSDSDERRSELARARDEIAERFGKGAITRARLVHEPEVHDEDAESDVIDEDPLQRL
ncbi:MAG: DNA polymerase IV [Armatimonadota bacterium]